MHTYNNKLQAIVEQKKLEVARLYEIVAQNKMHVLSSLYRGEITNQQNKSFKDALTQPAVIAEIKRKSPSKGDLAKIIDPIALANKYIAGGAKALSILTDEKFFNGSLDDLVQVATTIKELPTPILRKDFMVDEIQIVESCIYGADAVLAIVAVLGMRTEQIIQQAKKLKLDVLVEVHNLAELDIALHCNAEIIGVNNRDLTTFEVNPNTALELIRYIPKHIVSVAESGIDDPKLARKYFSAGYSAVLIGETLVKHPHPERFIELCLHP
jgi:indole-3-glycerol phosphate synthase